MGGAAAGGFGATGLIAALALSLGSTQALGFTQGEPPKPPGPYVALRIDLYDDPASDAAAEKRLGEQRGSGVVVAPAGAGEWFVLTNAHVVDPGADAARAVPQVYAGGDWRRGEVIASDAEADLALIRMRFSEPLKTAEVSSEPPTDHVRAETHGFAGGKKYVERESELRRDLPLDGGSLATAPRRYFIRTTFAPGESGGAVTIGDQLVALIHGNDCEAGWGICVDQPSIREFLEPFLTAAEQPE
jgi:S1-C subfamily serine protease